MSSRDFPDGLGPTTAIGLSDESTADREISKHFTGSMEGVSTRFRGAMPSETPFLRSAERGSGGPYWTAARFSVIGQPVFR